MSKKPNLDGAGSADSMSNRMWGGRFTAAPSALMERINVSVGFDKRLYTQDIAGSKAHARMLGDVGIYLLMMWRQSVRASMKFL